MRRLLLCGGLDGRPRALAWLRRAVKRRRPDGILFAGGILDGSRRYGERAAAARGLAPDDARFVERCLHGVGRLGRFVALVPGPADAPLEDFLRLGMHAEVEFPGVHVVHATLVTAGDLAVCGLGGRIGAGNGTGCPRTLAEYHLRSLWAAKQPRRVLVLAAPPPGRLGGAEASPLVGELIDSLHPDLCVVGGPSEGRGTERVGRTFVVNPGRLADGWAALVDWSRPGEEKVECLDVRHADLAREPDEIGAGD